MGTARSRFAATRRESRIVSAYNVHALTTVLDEFQPDVVYVCAITGTGGFGLMACLQFLGVPWVWQLGDRVPHHLCSTRQRVIPGLAEVFSPAHSRPLHCGQRPASAGRSRSAASGSRSDRNHPQLDHGPVRVEPAATTIAAAISRS